MIIFYFFFLLKEVAKNNDRIFLIIIKFRNVFAINDIEMNIMNSSRATYFLHYI